MSDLKRMHVAIIAADGFERAIPGVRGFILESDRARKPIARVPVEVHR